MSSSEIRVRMAPSPTGYYHVGNARTAVFNWLFARQQGGTFVWRVEDTDRTRFVPDALDDQAASMDWLGITPDEGPLTGGDYGPYFQSERLALYREFLQPLVDGGHAYRCFCSPERLSEVRERRQRAGLKIGYDRHCRNLTAEEVAARLAAGETAVVRLAMPLGGELVLHDVLRGPIVFEAAEFEDVVLMKSDGFPTYHFAVVVDDHLMAISHVLRADEWVPSAPIQIQLYRVLGWDEPVWAHVPMVLNPNGRGKLSKRKTVDGSESDVMVQVREYRAAGYLPEALFNYLALLGWSFSADEDLFTREQALAAFRVEDIKTSPAAWNPDKLKWMNGVYIRQLAADDLAERLLPFLADAGLEVAVPDLLPLVPLIQERIETLADAPALLDFFWREVAPSAADLVPKGLDAAATGDLLAAAELVLADTQPWEPAAIEATLRKLAEGRGLKPGPAFQPLRVAITGKRVAPPLFETLEQLGRERSLERLAAARVVLDGRDG
jgi:glutamyl-tRNA synthetase